MAARAHRPRQARNGPAPKPRQTQDERRRKTRERVLNAALDILAEDVEDETHNTTRFVVLAREENWARQGSGPLVTSFVFRVRNLPAALYKAMGGFATNGVNMTKLESYMVDGNFFATQFYADVDGHPDDKGLAFALEELKFFSREFRIVGVYPGHPFRATFSEKAD